MLEPYAWKQARTVLRELGDGDVARLPGDLKKSMMKEYSSEASELNHNYYCDGVEYFKKADFKKAKNSFKSAIEYWPEDPQAWFALGNCYDELKRPLKAERCFRRALQFTTDKDPSDIYYNLGNALYDQNKLSEASEFYKKVSAQNKTYHLAQKNLNLINKEITDS